MAYKGTGEYQPGSYCKFCKVATKCRARAAQSVVFIDTHNQLILKFYYSHIQ